MKAIFFDTGPLISLTMSGLLWILKPLKEKYGGKFYITPSVKRELIERPLSIKRFSFEALQSLKLISEGTLEVYSQVPVRTINQLEKLANTSFSIDNKSVDVIQSGEVECIASALKEEADAFVTDERTLRLFIESEEEVASLLANRFQKQVDIHEEQMKAFSQQMQGIPIIRSVELVSIAIKMGLLDGYIPKQKDGKVVLLNSVLWALKFSGCAVTEAEIEELVDGV